MSLDDYDEDRAARVEKRSWLVTMDAKVEAAFHVEARDAVEAWTAAETEAADNPPPLPPGWRYLPGPFGSPWSASHKSGDVVELHDETTAEKVAGSAGAA